MRLRLLSGIVAALPMLSMLSCAADPHAAAQARVKRWRAKDFFTDPVQIRLADAVARGDTAAVDALVREGADVNATGKEGIPLLVWAIAKDSGAGFEALLTHGARLDALISDPARTRKGERTRQVIEIVASAFNPAFLRAALRRGFDPDYVPNPESKESLLFRTVWTHAIHNAEILLEAGADINQRDWSARPAILLAQGIRYYEMVAFLLDRGADPCIKDKWGYDLADLLRKYGDRGVTARERPHFTKVVAELKKRGLLAEEDVLH